VANSVGDQVDAQVALDASGVAWVVWSERTLTSSRLWSSQFAAASGWTAPAAISPELAITYFAPRLWVDPGGDVTVVWSQRPQGQSSPHILFSRHAADPSGPWEAVSDLGEGAYPRIAGDGTGNYLSIWSVAEDLAPSRWTVMSSHYRAGVGWGSSSIVASGDLSNITGIPSLQVGLVALDRSGHGIAFWELTAGAVAYNAFARYKHNTGWSRYSGLVSEEYAWGLPTTIVGSDELPIGVSVGTYHPDSASP